MNIELRLEQPEDYRKTEEIMREAFLQKTEQTVTAKTAMLLQFRRGKVNVFFLNYHLLR